MAGKKKSKAAIHAQRLRNLKKARAAKQQGEGFWDVVNKVKGAVTRGLAFAKDNKLATKALDIAKAAGLDGAIRNLPMGSAVMGGLEKAQAHGYGKRRRPRRLAGRGALVA